MGFYLPVILIPAFLVALLGKFFFPHKITKKEWLLQGAGVILSTLICMAIISGSVMGYSSDFSIFNGAVTGKDSVRVSCSHQYVCGETCHTETYRDSKGKSHSRRVCQPKYCDEHAYDIDWDVYTTLGTYTIDRVDRRGTKMPLRWDLTSEGDPVSRSIGVTNYMLLDEDRFKVSSAIHQKYLNSLPRYPEIYDYYRIHRVIMPEGTEAEAISDWLSNQLRKDGKEKELNVILVVTRNQSDYFYALLEHWKGARKNDVIIVYGIDDDKNIKWAQAMSWADGQDNQIMLKQLQSMTYERKFEQQLVEEQYGLIVKEFKRVPNERFEYLKAGWVPPTWIIVMMFLFNLGAALGVAYIVIKEDVV